MLGLKKMLGCGDAGIEKNAGIRRKYWDAGIEKNMLEC